MTVAVSGRTALVTGAGNGLGHAITVALSANGVRVVMVGRDLDRLRAAAARIEVQGNGLRTAQCDVSDPESVAALRRALSDEDISILVNNAGVSGPVRSLVDLSLTDWEEVFAPNVFGTFLMCRAFLPHMIAREHGDIINIASVSGKRPLPRRTPYCASKMAVIGLTISLAAEVGPLGVSVNTLSPGPVRGERMARLFEIEAAANGIDAAAAERAFTSRAALGRMIEEEEVGHAVVAMLGMPGLCAADIDLSAGMVAR
jgi:NAD(P)-dependent dehydrogenase (short-subunit alcohol dehydrogenase family)